MCTKQVVSARACANQFLPYSSSGIALFGMRTVQADSCLNSEQIETLFISVGGQEEVLEGGVILGRSPKTLGRSHFGPESQNLHVTVMIFYC
jgi:hypothetical protein